MNRSDQNTINFLRKKKTKSYGRETNIYIYFRSDYICLIHCCQYYNVKKRLQWRKPKNLKIK